jgi:hypothetical protein
MWERLVTAILLEAGHQQWVSTTDEKLRSWCTRQRWIENVSLRHLCMRQGYARNIAPWERWLERRLRPLWGIQD